jgi:hypothetical protein
MTWALVSDDCVVVTTDAQTNAAAVIVVAISVRRMLTSLVAEKFTPRTPYLRAVLSLLVSARQSTLTLPS